MIADSFVSIALNALGIGSAVLLAAWVAVRVFARRSASTRAAIWAIGLALSVIAPVVRGLESPASEAASAVVEREVIRTGSTAAELVDEEERVARLPMPPTNGPAIIGGGTWPSVAFLIWIVVAAVLLGRVAVAFFALRRERRDAAPADPALAWLTRQLARRAGVGRSVGIVVSREDGSPRLIGGVRPTIVLPVSLAAWDARRLEPILLHELAHARRFDDVACLLQKVVQATLFFHPIVHFAARRLDEDRELACDDDAVRTLGSPRRLARALTDVVLPPASHGLAPTAASTASVLARRIRRLIRDDALDRPLRPWRLVPAVALAILSAWLVPVVRVAGDVPFDGRATTVRYGLAGRGVDVTVEASWRGVLPNHAEGALELVDRSNGTEWRRSLVARPGHAPTWNDADQPRLTRLLAAIASDGDGGPEMIEVLEAWGLHAVDGETKR